MDGHPSPPGSDPTPLSFGQEKLWVFERQLPDGVGLHPPLMVRLVGPLNRPAVRAALSQIQAMNGSLRTRFPFVGGVPVQHVDPPESRALPVIDLGPVPPADRRGELARVVRALAERPYDLEQGPLCRPALVRLATDDHVLLFGVHHLVFDLWSKAVLARQLTVATAAATAGAPLYPGPPPCQYVDYTRWHRGWLGGDRLAREEAFWLDRLRGIRELPLPLDFPRPDVPNLHRQRIWSTADTDVAASLREFCRREGLSVFVALLAAFQVFLARLTGASRVVVVSPSAGRARAEHEDLIGFVVRDVWLRGDLSGALTFRAVVERARREVLEVLDRADVPYEQVAAAVDPVRDLRPHPLLQIHFSASNLAAPGLRLGAAEIGGVDLEGPSTYLSPTDLEMQIDDVGVGPFRWNLVYDDALFARSTVERLGERFRLLLARVVARPDSRIDDEDFHAPSEIGTVEDWNGPALSPPPSDVDLPSPGAHRLDGIALDCGPAGQVTRRALSARVRHLVGVLRDHGVGIEDAVGVDVAGPAFVSGLLAVLACGAAAVPLGPGDTGFGHLVLDPERAAVTGGRGRACTGPPGPLACALILKDGVEVTRAGLEHAVRLLVDIAGPAAGGRWSVPREQPMPLVPVAAVLAAMEAGGTLGWESDPCSAPADVALATTRAWVAHAATGRTSSAVAVCCADGSPMSADVALALRSRGVKLWNVMEVLGAGVVTAEAVHDSGSAPRGSLIPGRPASRQHCTIVDARGMFVPIGLPGELAVTGPQVLRGMRGRPAATADALRPAPGGRRVYATGRTLRFRFDGRLEPVGSTAEEIEIGGHRIVRGDVERVLAAAPGIAAAAVGSCEHDPGGGVVGPRLTAWVVPEPGADPSAADLREWAAARLAAHAVPTLYRTVPQLPPPADGDDGEALRVGHGPPRTSAEREMARIWGEILGVSPIGREDNFFLLGGHSLLAAAVVERTRATWGEGLTLGQFLHRPVLSAVAAVVDSRRRKANQPR